MTEVLTAAQMRAIEQAAIESGEVTGLELMERAGRGVIEAVFEEWPELAATPHRAVVLCGPGNNGGDGFVVARLLKEWGWEVEVFLYGDPAKMPPDAKVNYERWLEFGPPADLACAAEAIERFPDVTIDALFGTGLTRPISNEVSEILGAFQQQPHIVAIDVPSGMDSDSGKLLCEDENADVLRPWLTVSFHRAKLGHFLATEILADALKTVDIGLPSNVRGRLSVLKSRSGQSTLLTGAVKQITSSSMIGKTNFSSNPNKYSHGHAFLLSGGPGKTGAARLAARGALRIGAGLVTLGVTLEAQQEVASQVTSIMLTCVDDGVKFGEILKDERLNALCLGPGLGLDRARELVPLALSAAHKPSIVLDADALTAFAGSPETLFERLHGDCVLTPHGGEFARLFPDISEKLNATPTKGPAYSKVDATRAAAKRAGCVVLFKGPDTVIAAPDGRCSINSAHYERSVPWLATAGSGDVLAGFITGLMARGFDPMLAAETAAWLHVECALSFGPGLIAEDLPEELPNVFRQLGV